VAACAAVSLWACSDGPGVENQRQRAAGSNTSLPGRIILVALDAFHPKYLTLDARGRTGGAAGNWLTPNLRRYLAKGTWYPGARDHLPSATDMNHLNAVAGTSSGQTGVVGVGSQFRGWGSDGKPVVDKIHVADFRDDKGRPIDTLFHAFKRRWPSSHTAYVSGKDWVAEGYRSTGAVDTIVTGSDHPSYVQSPVGESVYDPPSDSDARCDPESARQKEISLLIKNAAEKTPPDSWIVSATLALYANEAPDLAYVLLAQTDDAGHALGAAHLPSEYSPTGDYDPPLLCVNHFDYRYVSGRDSVIFREPVLDNIRQVDQEFGRLMDGLESMGMLADATVVVLSDHAMVTHLRSSQIQPRSTDYVGALVDAKLVTADSIIPYSATSYAAVYLHPSIKQNVPAAKQVLAGMKAYNVETRRVESPWWVLDRDEMKNGLPGVVGPGELYHDYFVDADNEKTLAWPDLFLFAKAGFQIPAYGGMLANLDIDLPVDNLRLSLFVGGHGSVDTQPILMAFVRPGGKASQVLEKDVRISDISPTLRSLFGLDTLSTAVGRDLSADL
jgi:predicted AlkP superfamily pyrophosphatase or phosphodiesterase